MEKTSTPVGSHAPDFELPGIDDRVYHLARYLEEFQAVGAIFMSNQCPYVRLYLDRLKQIQDEFQSLGATVIGINANDALVAPVESFEQMKSFAAEWELNFPYLRDPNQDVARTFGASVTPEAFLLDRRGIIRYHGAIDDRPNQPEAVTSHYLRDAIALVLAGEAIATSSTEPIGSPIEFRQH